MTEFAGHDLELWYTPLASARRSDTLAACRGVLSDSEKKEADRFVFEKNREQFAVARALLRMALSHYNGTDPQAWRFQRNEFGKPAVVGSPTTELSFNVSHTDEVVVCAVSPQPRVGVDVERIDRSADYLTIARRFFAAAEIDYLEAAPRARRAETFFQIWTLKESYIKARGQGLSIPLDAFAFCFSREAAPTLELADGSSDDASRWQFAQLRLSESFQIAAAVELPPGQRLHIASRKAIPPHEPGELTEVPLTAGYAIVP